MLNRACVSGACLQLSAPPLPWLWTQPFTTISHPPQRCWGLQVNERSVCRLKQARRSHGQCGITKGLMSKHPSFLPSFFTACLPSFLHSFLYSVLPSFLLSVTFSSSCLPAFQTLTCKRAWNGAVWVRSRCSLGAGQIYCRRILAAVLVFSRCSFCTLCTNVRCSSGAVFCAVWCSSGATHVHVQFWYVLVEFWCNFGAV